VRTVKSIELLTSAFEALDDCEAALRKLDATCCEPGRSPRMKILGQTLIAARGALSRVTDDPGAAGEASGFLEEAGAQVGRLQVGCCAPKRLPLYTRILHGLTTAHQTLDRALGSGH